MKKIKPEIELKIAEMIDGGISVKKIAEKLKVSVAAVSKRKLKIKNSPKKSAEEIIGDQLFFPDIKSENKIVEKIKDEIVDEISDIVELTKKYNSDIEKIRQEYKSALLSIVSAL